MAWKGVGCGLFWAGLRRIEVWGVFHGSDVYFMCMPYHCYDVKVWVDIMVSADDVQKWQFSAFLGILIWSFITNGLRGIFSTLFHLRAKYIIYHASFMESMDNSLSVSHTSPALVFKHFQSAPFGGGPFPSSRNVLTPWRHCYAISSLVLHLS